MEEIKNCASIAAIVISKALPIELFLEQFAKYTIN
jgi:hypothetical protein